MTNKQGHTGAKYEETKDLDIAQVAKLVRADVKTLQAAGELPAGKASVRISRFAGGQSMSLTFRMHSLPEWGGPEHRALTARLEGIMTAYTFDYSDAMTDYFWVRFYTHAHIEELKK